MANEIKELSDWADKALTKGDGPPPGYTAIPGGKKGGYRKPKAGGGWSYVYTQGSAGKSKPEPEHEDEGSSREPISAKAFSDMMSDPDWTTGQLMDFAGITGLNHEDILDAIRVVVRKHNYAGLETLARKSLESASTLDRPVWARLARIASKAVEIEAAEKAATDKAD